MLRQDHKFVYHIWHTQMARGTHKWHCEPFGWVDKAACVFEKEPGTVFTTINFLHNLGMDQVSKNVTLD